jgi:type I restriction enzyme S subunit
MSRVSEIRSNAKGTTYPEISKGRFRDMDVVIPAKSLIKEFGDYAGNLFRQIRCLKRKSVGLETARDLLLPRLMNGEITV